MKFKVLAVCLFLAGITASLAIAGPPAGKGNNKHATTTNGTTTSPKQQKVTLCQPTGSKTHPYSKITVAASSVKAHIKKGAVKPDANGKCPATAPTTTTTTSTTTTATTTAATTTTHA